MYPGSRTLVSLLSISGSDLVSLGLASELDIKRDGTSALVIVYHVSIKVEVKILNMVVPQCTNV